MSGAKTTQVSQSQVPHFAGNTSPARLTSHRGVHSDMSRDFIVPSLGNHGGQKPPESEVPLTITMPRHLLTARTHKWNLRFDEASDPLTLFAEVEEKIATYGITPVLCQRFSKVERHDGSARATYRQQRGRSFGPSS